MESVKECFNADYLTKLNAVSLHFANKLKAGRQGARKAGGRGNSLEFSDYKQYSFGDDMRRIDWNAYARTGRLHLKLFSDEKQACCNIFIDISKSMDYGKSNKAFFARVLAGSIGYIFLNHSEKVNIFAFDQELSPGILGVDSKLRFPALLECLDSLAFTRPGNEKFLPQGLSQYKTGDGINFVVSDFFSENYEGISGLREKASSTVLVHVLCKEETEPENLGRARLVDCETGKFRDLDINPERLKKYGEKLETFKSHLRKTAGKAGFGYVFVSSSEDLISVIKNLF